MRLLSSLVALVMLFLVLPMDNPSHASRTGATRTGWLAQTAAATTEVTFCDRYLHICGAPSEVWDIVQKKARGTQAMAAVGLERAQATETWQRAAASFRQVGKIQHAHAALTAEDVETSFAGANRWRSARLD
jgi:hypothetical protein